VAAIVVDILTCSDDPTGALVAQRIAREIARRVAGPITGERINGASSAEAWPFTRPPDAFAV
jgi:hypothetical protein